VKHRILVVGVHATGERIDRADFDADTPLHHYGCVVLDPAVVPGLWRSLVNGPPESEASREEAASRLAATMGRRRREASQLLRDGGTLVCLLRPLGQPFRIVRRGADGPVSVLYHAYSWLPEGPSLQKLVIAAAREAELHPRDDGHPAWQLLGTPGGTATPVACAANVPPPDEWHVIATDGQGRLLAFEVPVGRGRVLFIPPLPDASEAEQGKRLEAFFPAPSPIAEAIVQPEWAASVLLPGQAELGERLPKLSRQLEALEREFVEARERHARLEKLNQLLTARSADELAGPAEAAFRTLGFDVEAAGGAALRLRAKEGAALVVLSAGEQAAEAEGYWELVRRLDEAGDEQPKGIILANAYCTLAPGERPAAFPELLCRGAQHRQVCLLATTELHAAVAAALRGPEEGLRKGLRKAILGTVGPCTLSGHSAAAEDENGENDEA